MDIAIPPVEPEVRARLEGRVMLLGVGAQKAGTSWLFKYLAADPKIAASPLKELHFFSTWLSPRLFKGHDRAFLRMLAAAEAPAARLLRAPRRLRALEERRTMMTDRAEYLRYFARRAGERRFLLEISPSYEILDVHRLRVVRRYFESAGVAVRPILLLRDPIERHYSALRMAQRDAKLASAKSQFLPSLGFRSHVRHSRYDRTLRKLWSAFGEDAVSVAFYEHVTSTPEIHLRALVEGLGLDWRAPDLGARVNASPRHAELGEADVAAALELYRPVYDFVRANFGAETPASWRA